MKVVRRSAKAPISLYLVLTLVVISGVVLAQHNKNAPAPPVPAPKPPSAPHQSAPPQSHPPSPPSNASHGAMGNAPHGGSPAGNNAPHGNMNAPGHGNSTAGGTNNAHGANAAHGNNTAGSTNNAHGTNAAHGTNTAGGTNNARGANAAHGNNTAGGANNAHGANAGHGPTGAGGANGAHGAVTKGGTHPGGANAAGGNSAHGPNGAHATARREPPTTVRQVHTRSGQTVQASFRGGHVRAIQAHNMRIERGMQGQRRVVMEHNGRQIVAMGRNRGFVQRAYFNRNGRVYVQRTYYVGGQRYAYAYRTYYYGGSPYYYYAPAYYYQPAYYGWAYNPWPQPVYYNWGWNAQPWYGYYGPYYQPYPAYPTASSWVTDYMVADYLKAAYEARQQANALPPPHFASSEAVAGLLSTDPLVANLMTGGQLLPGAWAAYLPAAGKEASQAQMSPEVKQAITEEVKAQIAAEKDAAANPNAKQSSSGGDQLPALDPSHHLFIVFSNLSASTNDGQDCDLNAGDVLYRTGDAAGDDGKVDVTVKSAQKDDCPVGTNTAVELNDLQEMQNHLREEMDSGLKELASKQGKNGLPAAPDTKTTGGEVPPPAADSNADKDLDQAQKDADQTESEVSQDSSASGTANNQ